MQILRLPFLCCRLESKELGPSNLKRLSCVTNRIHNKETTQLICFVCLLPWPKTYSPVDMDTLRLLLGPKYVRFYTNRALGPPRIS